MLKGIPAAIDLARWGFNLSIFIDIDQELINLFFFVNIMEYITLILSSLGGIVGFLSNS